MNFGDSGVTGGGAMWNRSKVSILSSLSSFSSSPCDTRVTKIHVHNLINIIVIIKKIPCKSVNPFSFFDHFNFGYKPLVEKPPWRAAVFDFGNSPGHGERFFT